MQLAFPQLTWWIRARRCHLKSCEEKVAMVMFPLLFILPPFQTFSRSFCFQSNCYPIHHASHPPSANEGNKVPHHHHPLAVCCMEKMVMVSFTLFLFFPKLNCFLVGCTRHPPSVYQGNKITPPPSLQLQWVFLLFLSFPHWSNFFLPEFFPLNCYSVGRCQLTSLSQSREQ